MTDTGFRKKKQPFLELNVSDPDSRNTKLLSSDSDIYTTLQGMKHPHTPTSASYKIPASPLEAQHALHHRRLSLPINTLDRRNKVPEQVQGWNPTDLLYLLAEEQPESTLFLDVRTFAQYTESRVQDAVSVCIPSTLLKRSTFGFERMLEFLPPEQVERVADPAKFTRIVIYDAKTMQLETCGINPLYCTINKVYAHLQEKELLDNTNVGYIRGGLQAVEECSASVLLDKETLNSDGHPDSNPRSPFNLRPVFTGLNLAHTWGTVTPSSISNVAYDVSCSVEVSEDIYDCIDNFPVWLRNVVQESRNGHNVLAGNFQRLQINEQARIQQALSRDTRPRRSQATRAPGSSSSLTLPTSPPQLYQGSAKTSATSDSSAITPVAPAGLTPFVSTRSPARSSPARSPARTPNTDEIDYSFCTGDDVSKNRYSNICPYTHTRVVLDAAEDEPDYINASYINTSQSSLHYIATQAPLPNSFNDFWKVVWDHRVPIIVMLTTLASESGQIKGHNYWKTGQYGDISVVSVEKRQCEELSTVVLRYITLEKKLPDGQVAQHTVVHIYYDLWPDLGRPDSVCDMLALVNIKARLLDERKAAGDCSERVVVHCSAGCGRTGTFCTVDSVIDHLRSSPMNQRLNEPEDLINKTVEELRSQRLAMVQVQRQFLYCYEVIILWYYRAFALNENIPEAPSHLKPVYNDDQAVQTAF